MRRANQSLIKVNRCISRTIVVALVVGAIALLSLGTRPAETQETSAQPLYKVQDLGTLVGGSRSQAAGINNFDKVVGGSSTSDGFEHAFLYSDGVMRDLNNLIPANSGWTLTSAEAINGNGSIVGYGNNPDGLQHAFLLRPTS
jgi:probable HAF family extracellular repeat protein